MVEGFIEAAALQVRRWQSSNVRVEELRTKYANLHEIVHLIAVIATATSATRNVKLLACYISCSVKKS